MDGNHDAGAVKASGTNADMLSLAMLRNSMDCVKLLNMEGRITFMSENGMCAMEIDNHENVAGRTWWDLWPTESRAPLRKAFQKALTGDTATFAGKCPTAVGTLKNWDVRITPVTNDDGSITSVLAVSREVA